MVDTHMSSCTANLHACSNAAAPTLISASPDSCISPLLHCVFSSNCSISVRSSAVEAVRPCTMSARGQTCPARVCAEPMPFKWVPEKYCTSSVGKMLSQSNQQYNQAWIHLVS